MPPKFNSPQYVTNSWSANLGAGGEGADERVGSGSSSVGSSRANVSAFQRFSVSAFQCQPGRGAGFRA